MNTHAHTLIETFVRVARNDGSIGVATDDDDDDGATASADSKASGGGDVADLVGCMRLGRWCTCAIV
jgi:hypothetical protein